MDPVLIIEDDKELHVALTEVLEEEGIPVTGVFSGEDALSLEGDFSLLVTDVRLGGIDGIESLARLRQTNPDLPCIVITGYASSDSPARAIRLNVLDYLMKPFGLEEFIRVVRRALTSDERRTADEVKGFPEVVEDREGIFQALYVGIRSGLLDEVAARDFYSLIESLEAKYRRVLGGVHTLAPDLRQDYAKLTGFLLALHRHPENPPPSNTDGLPPLKNFRQLYRLVKNGEINSDELMYAPVLRINRPEGQHLRELKARIWPEA